MTNYKKEKKEKAIVKFWMWLREKPIILFLYFVLGLVENENTNTKQSII